MGQAIPLVSATILSLLPRSKQTMVQIIRDVSTNAGLQPVSALLNTSIGWTMRQSNAVSRPYLLPNHLSSSPAVISQYYTKDACVHTRYSSFIHYLKSAQSHAFVYIDFV